MKIRVGVSNRHIHLCKKDADMLFGTDYEFKKRNDLSQVGEYACEEVVKISTSKGEFPYVRVLGPLRDYTQVEISQDDAMVLGIDPPIRDSGDLENSESVWISGPNGKIYKENCCIRANRHIHCNKLDNIGHNNRDIVKVKYFSSNEYLFLQGMVSSIDFTLKKIKVIKTIINFDDILNIEIESHFE